VRRGQKRGIPAPLAGALTLLVIAVATWFGFTKEVPFRSHFEVEAAFRTANNVKPGSPVRVAGVEVGKVVDVRPLPGDRPASVVRMRLRKRGLPLRTDARMAIRPRIFLEGNFFVDVQPGTPSAPVLGDGDRIPVSQTSSPVQLDQVLGALTADTRKDLQGLLRELGTGLSGKGARGYNRSIPFWEPAYRDSAIVADALRADGDLSRYLASGGAFAEGLSRGRLQELVDAFATTARAFGRAETELAAGIGELPRTLDAGLPALAALNASFPAVRRLARDARDGVRSSAPALRASTPLARELRGLLSAGELQGLARELRAVVPDLARLNGRLPSLYEQVRALSSCQTEAILPWSSDTIQDRTFPAQGKVFEEAPKPLVGLAGESRSGDANGQWFRVLLARTAFQYAYPLGTDRFALTGQPLQGVNPPKKDIRRPPLRPDAPCEVQERPDLRTEPDPAPPGIRLKKLSPADPAVQRALARAVDKLREQTKGTGVRVSDVPVTAKELLGR
jgi:phospholipid/cholesterol/gamma-HCH transport system substrate-binding protein